MAGQQNAFLNSGVTMPMFTGVSQSSGQHHTTDIDIGDLFADYLVNEKDSSHQNAYNHLATLQGSVQGVANPLLAPVPDAIPQAFVPTLTNPNQSLGSLVSHQQQSGASNIALPTRRGIQTAFHTNGLTNLQATVQPTQQVRVYGHVAKKVKHDSNNQQNTMMHSNIQSQNQQAMVNNVNLGQNNSTGSGISGRLGFSMVGGQLALPNRGAKNTVELREPAQSSENVTNSGSTVPDASGNISLPIGIGIRIGGQTGAVHPSHQDSKTAPAPNAAQQSHWGVWSSAGILGVENGRGGLSEQVIAERRQRNREHAKRSRVRKKFLLESLQEQVRALQKENSSLRMFVYENIPQDAQRIISDCCKSSPLFSDRNDKKDSKDVELVKSDFSLIESLSTGQQNFVLSDPRLPDNPIVFASEGFYKLTGYTREQVLGRNCRFLQGPDTNQQSLDVVRTAIANGTDATACLLNYKADGTPFWNQFFVAALRDADNNIVNYVGVQCAVEPEAGTSALEDKVNAVMPLLEKEDGSGIVEEKKILEPM